MLQAGLAVWVVSILPSLAPVLPPDLEYGYADQYSDVAVLLLAVALAVWTALRTKLPRERRFWLHIAGAVLAWLGVRGLYVLVPYESWGTGADLASDLLYLTGYLLLAMALEDRPDRSPARGLRTRLRWTERVGTLVFAFGLLAYFVVIPSVFTPDAYASWVPSLLLYAVLDAYLMVRCASILARPVGGAWRWPYRWLAVSFGLWLLGDAVEGLMYLEVLPWVDPGTPADLLWHLPALTLLVAIRSVDWPPPERDEGEPVTVFRSLTPGSQLLPALALSLPALHLTLHYLGAVAPASEGPRELLLLALLVILATLLARHERLLGQMTHLVEEERRRISSQLQVSQRMEAVGRLAAGVAHDFSNLLSVIRGRAELLGMGPRGSGGDLDEIVYAAQRGESLVAHLMTLSRRRPQDPMPLDLGAVVTEMEPLLTRLLSESVRLRVEVPDAPTTVVADQAQLEQVVLNLAVNARDAMPDGGEVRLQVASAEPDDTFVLAHGGSPGDAFGVLRVSDSGPGVPAALRGVVFEPFFTTKGEGQGSGLGLSIVYGVARQAGGFARVAEAPGAGALFEVYLPLSRARLGTAVGRTDSIPRISGKEETVLLVEDDPHVRATTRRMLRGSGYRVLEAESAAEALAILERRNEPIDLLFTDLVLPDLSGFELRERSLERRPGLATLFMSGYPRGVRPMRLPEGVPLLEKPFDGALLASTVRKALSERGPRESLGS